MGERGVGGRGGISTENYGSYLHRMGGGGGGGEKEGKQGDESRETKGEVRNENGGEEIEGK